MEESAAGSRRFAAPARTNSVLSTRKWPEKSFLIGIVTDDQHKEVHMRYTRAFSVKLRCILGYPAFLLFGVMCVSPSWADNCTGYDALVTQSAETTDLGHGLKQTSFRSTAMLFSDDSMYNLVGGECAGTVLQTEDGKTQQMGYCARHDKDGDTQSVSFQQAPGADKGEWKSTGGTGKFAGKENSGWFQNVLMDGKNLVTKWGGDCR